MSFSYSGFNLSIETIINLMFVSSTSVGENLIVIHSSQEGEITPYFGLIV